MKRFFLLLLALMLAVSPAAAFYMPEDVPYDAYYYLPVRDAIELKILPSTGLFYPEKPLTRAQFVDWFIRALEVEKIEPKTASFSDVSINYWAFSAIETAKSLGLVSGTQKTNGTPTGKFEPNALVNRAQAAVIVMKAFTHLTTNNLSFPDLSKVLWAEESIKRAAVAGFFAGYPNGTFGPANNILRAEGITVFMKINYKLEKKELGTAFKP